MTRKISLSPLNQWEEEEKHSKIGLLTLYRMQNQTNTIPAPQQLSDIHKNENKLDSNSPRERQKKVASQQMDNIFSHRSIFDKRKKFLSNQKKKKLANQSKPLEDKKTLLTKQYSFEEMNQEEVRHSWLRNKIFREFIVNDNTQRKTEQTMGNGVLLKMMSSRGNQNKSRRVIYNNRFHTQGSESEVNKQRYTFKQEETNQANTINHSQRNNHFLEAQFMNRRNKYFNKKNPDTLRDYIRKNKSKGPKYIDFDNYSSNLLTSSLQNMPCQAINEVHGSTPRTDRLKDTIKQYLKSIERRSFSKKITILQSI